MQGMHNSAQGEMDQGWPLPPALPIPVVYPATVVFQSPWICPNTHMQAGMAATQDVTTRKTTTALQGQGEANGD